MLLATDLDGTFLGGSDLHKHQLYDFIKQNSNARLVFVTGRGLASVIPLFNDPAIPIPDYIICDVGATIVNGQTYKPVGTLQSEIENNWPGSSTIMEALSALTYIHYQDVPQQRRCSFFIDDEALIPKIKELVSVLKCDVIYSAGKFLDILPNGVNKGSSLQKLVRHLNCNINDVLVAGDTLNDLSMYQCGFKGVVVGRPEKKLAEATAGMEDVYHANAAGAGGILEALHYFKGFVNDHELKTA